MKNQDLILNVIYAQGKADALSLRNRAANMDGTGIIAEEEKIPMFDPEKDYTEWTIGAPVYDIIDNEKQVFTLLIPHNASHYPNVRPNNNRTLWSITHTKDANKAKPYIAPSGVSGMYMIDEVCTDPNAENNNAVYRSVVDNNVYAPSEYAPNWVLVE